MVIKKIVVGMLETNCYIVSNNNECIIIDPGDDYEKIISNIKDIPKAILLTHSHFDHIGAVNQLKNKFNIEVYSYYNIKDKINIANFKIDVINTPGHTDDSVTYYFKKDNVMFTGDFIFYNSIGRTDLETGNPHKMKDSINKILQYDDTIKIYPGHGKSTSIGYERINNIYLK